MIEFHRLKAEHKEAYNAILMASGERGCEYSFSNLFLWGRQHIAFTQGCVAFFSHFYGRSVYPYPVGTGDKKAVIEAILHDAKMRGLPCRLVGLTEADRQELENWFPGMFHLRPIRNSFDYIYSIHDLADLKGRKFQKKRNHFNRFKAEHPDYRVEEITPCNMRRAQQMVDEWYRKRIKDDPEGDYLLENIAMARAFQNFGWLGLEGIMILDGEQVIAVTVSSRMAENMYDIHFEKALEDVDGAYNAVNCEFARFLREKHPEVEYLNREDDMGLEGLRKAKLSYNPHHMVEKYWAYVAEDIYGD